jgi:hypothetical protein
LESIRSPWPVLTYTGNYSNQCRPIRGGIFIFNEGILLDAHRFAITKFIELQQDHRLVSLARPKFEPDQRGRYRGLYNR